MLEVEVYDLADKVYLVRYAVALILNCIRTTSQKPKIYVSIKTMEISLRLGNVLTDAIVTKTMKVKGLFT